MTENSRTPNDSQAIKIANTSLGMHPTRPTEAARLRAARLTIESGLSLTQVFEECSRILGETLNVARVGVWLMSDDREALRCAALYELQSQTLGRGIVLQAADYPNFFAALRARKIIPAELALIDPMTNELVESYFQPLNIASTLDAPLLVAGEVAGVIFCEQVGAAREWTTKERDFVESIANIVVAKIRAAEVKQLRELLACSEPRVAKSDHDEVLGRMAVQIAHDFRNILTVVQNCTEIMTMTESSASVQKSCDLIKQAVDRGTHFVKELADYGRTTPKKPVVIDVNDQIIAFLPILRGAVEKSNPLQFKVAEGIGKILIDLNHLERILLNLIRNAKEATPPGETIEVAIARRQLDDSQRRTCACIEVRDRGNGMTEETRLRLFEPFLTTKAAGTGLGMPIVQRFVERASGTIEVESEPDVGTTIRLLFPLVGS